jgi:hypothetical protein
MTDFSKVVTNAVLITIATSSGWAAGGIAIAQELELQSQSQSESDSVGSGDRPIWLSSDWPSETSLNQLTSVSQLSDVKPTDWAFQALQSLVERYGCIVGYPDRTYRGNQALTRYEFAAGLNACLDKIQELIAAATENFVKKEDLEIVKRLQEEFAAELATVAGRVDALDVRTATLEKQQFSATTKLSGVVNFVLTDVFSGDGDTEATFQQRSRLLFSSSFTGRDLLVTRIAAGNAVVPDLAGGTREIVQSTQWYGNFDNRFFLVTSYYLFPVTQNLIGLVAAGGGLHADYAPTLSPFEDYDAGTTSLSVFALRNPIYRLGGGTGAGFLYQITPQFTLSAGYLAGAASNPANGLFNGNYSTLAQVTWTPVQQFSLALTYNHGYFPTGTFGFGDNSSTFGLGAYTGTGIVNNTLSQFPTIANSYGAEFSWKLSPAAILSGWIGLTNVRAIGAGAGDIWTYALTFAFPDLGKRGNLGGLILGAPPYLTGLNRFRPPNSNHVPIALEAFYRYQLTDNISITPGVIWVNSPNQSSDNQELLLGIIRTSFTF